MLCSTLSLSFLLLLLLLMLLAGKVDSGCQFPASLQTNGTGGAMRDWVGHVREQFTDVGIHIVIATNIIRVTASDSTSRRSYTVVCLQTVSSDRYLVAYEETGQRVARYSCLQFVQRSSDVIQMRAAAVSARMDRLMCRDGALITDQWLIVDRSRLGRNRAPCPLHGGYSVHLFDKSHQKGVCDAYRGETRVESDCERGDGVVFLFRRTHCVPADMYMYSRQPTRCVAAWTDDSSAPRSYRFTVLRHDDPQHAYYWLLRTPASASVVDGDGAAFSAVLFKDLVADSSPLVNETHNYIRVDMQPDDDQSSLCADEYEMCWDSMMEVERRCRQGREGGQQLTAWHSLALTCPRTCRLCDDASPTSCQLPASWRGRWIDGASGAAVTINETAVHVSRRRRAAGDDDQSDVDALAMSCVQWRTDAASDDNLTMLVTVYGAAGCRPRYRCARVLRQSSSLLYLQLSDASSWPLVRSPRDPVDCRAFHFDRWTSTSPAVSASDSSVRTTSGYLLSLVAPGGASVDCRLPAEVAGFQYEADFVADDDKCRGTLTETGGTLRLTLSGCGSVVVQQFADPVYKCVESSTVAESEHDLLIITSSGSRSTLSCWLFTHITRRSRGRSSSLWSFYLLTGDQCHTAVAARPRSSFRPARQLTHTAFFSRPRPLSTTTVHPPQTTPSQSSRLTQPAAPSTVWTTKNSRRPRPRNVTIDDSDQDQQSGGFVNAFVVGVVAVLLAVMQLILLCRC